MARLFFPLFFLSFFSAQTWAADPAGDFLFQKVRQIFQRAPLNKKLNWQTGDRVFYKVNMGIIKGTMDMKVTDISEEGIWTLRIFDLGFAGKETTQSLIDLETGETLRLIVNGHEYQPTPSNNEVIDVQQEKITVPAGTFECAHARLRDLDTSKEFEIWVNPNEIPLSGMIKTVQPGQFGPITILLNSYFKN